MSLFPRAIISEATPSAGSGASYHPLFRFFDEFDQYSRAPERASRSTTNNSPFSLLKSNMTFTPKFDVKEGKDSYELHGEFPGIDQKDIEIEFTDSNTLSIKGRTERSYRSGTPLTTAGSIEGAKTPTSITDNDHDYKAKVEDEEAATSTEVTNTNSKREVGKQHQYKEPEEKYWVSERSVGEFSRTFSFPVRIDQDAVKASMKNGILSVIVPKAKKQESRKISIQ